ncbi:CYTH-like domain [Trinorchestia longiramus]|nr:CYTH-like domain [Trinorchestia longiramus]
MVGQTRVHVDRVQGLGDFMELEVVLREDQTAADGQVIAGDLMKRLGVQEANLLSGAYMDMIKNTTNTLGRLNHQLGRLVSESASEREDPGSNPAADMVDAARNTAWDLAHTVVCSVVCHTPSSRKQWVHSPEKSAINVPEQQQFNSPQQYHHHFSNNSTTQYTITTPHHHHYTTHNHHYTTPHHHHHHYTTPPPLHYTQPPLHNTTPPPLHYKPPPLHYTTPPPLHYTPPPPLHHTTSTTLHTTTTTLHHHTTSSRRQSV